MIPKITLTQVVPFRDHLIGLDTVGRVWRLHLDDSGFILTYTLLSQRVIE